VRKIFLKALWIHSLALILPLFVLNHVSIGLAAEQDPYAVKPWEVGQYVLYQIVTFEGEGKNNRYEISLTGKENVEGKTFFWMQIDIYENFIYHGYNTKTQKLEKNVSFIALVPPKDRTSFVNNPSLFLSDGVLPKDAVKLAMQIKNGDWHWVDPKNIFSHQHIIEDTPYILTPDAKGKIDFSKLKIDPDPMIMATQSGDAIPQCYHFFVHTTVEDEYWDEGLDVWRSSEIPILGIVRMDFSQTQYWDKWSHRNEHPLKRTFLDFFHELYKKRVPGRRNPDTCIVRLLDYGPK